MTQDERMRPMVGEQSPPGGARRVATSRAERRPKSARGARGGGRRKAPQPGKIVFKVILSSLLALGLATGVGVVLLYNNWNGNLDRENLSAQLGTDRPEKVATGPLDILVMGDDTRSGKGNAIDGEGGGGSDTTILFHLSADRKFAYGISIPRDTVIDRPECYKKGGAVIPAQAAAQWNAAYAVGGPACTIRQVEQLTGIRVDNYIVVDFNGFKDMVDALGGVEVCIPEDIEDEEHGITLKAGTREIKGQQALSYVRVRHIGDGTDPQRIKRQQAFMASMISKAVGADTLAQPVKLTKFINATTSSLKTDFENIAQLADIAASFNGIGLDNISFVTTPWVYSTAQPGRVEWTPEVRKLWRLARTDRRLTKEFLGDSISAGENTDGSSSASGGASSGTTESTGSTGTPGSPGTGATDGATDGATADPQGMSDDARARAGLC